MNRILKIGMDVHSTNYTLCVAEPKLEGEPDYLYEVEVEPDYLNVIKVITNLKKKYKDDTLHITCGYEAGCLGYNLYHQLDNVGIKCVHPGSFYYHRRFAKRQYSITLKEQPANCWLLLSMC